MADENNSRNTASKVQEAARTAVTAAKGAGKAVAGDVAGAVKEGVKILPQILKVCGILFLIFALLAGTFLYTPALIWNGIKESYQEWTLTQAIDVIDEAFNKSAANVCDNAIDSINYFIDDSDFETLRNSFYADGQDGISVMALDNGDTFYIAIDETGNDVLICYYNADDNDFVEFRYLNGNNFTNDSTSIDYAEIINAYVYWNALQYKDKDGDGVPDGDTTQYEFTYADEDGDGEDDVDADGNKTVTGVEEVSGDETYDSIYGDSDGEGYALGLTDVAGLYKKLTDSDVADKIYDIKYVCETEDGEEKTFDELDSKDAKKAANNSELAKENDYDHYYQISISVSTYSSETKSVSKAYADAANDDSDSESSTSDTEVSNEEIQESDDDSDNGITYSTLTRDMFDLSDEDMYTVAEKSAISNGIIEAATQGSSDDVELPDEYSSYFVFSPSKKIFDNIIGGMSVLQQMTADGLIMDGLTESSVRSLVAAQAVAKQKEGVTVSYSDIFGITNEDTFKKYFGDEMKNASVGDSGLFCSYIFYTVLSNSTLKLRDSLFKTDDDSIIYKSQDYAQYFKDNNSYYTDIDFDSDNKIEIGDMLFFDLRHTPVYTGTGSSGVPYIYQGDPVTQENNQVGIVTSISGESVTVVIYNFQEDRDLTDKAWETVQNALEATIDQLIGGDCYTVSTVTIDFSSSSDPYVNYISGYGKPDYEGFVSEYNTLYAKQIESLQTSNSTINSNNGSGQLGYPTTYRDISAGYPNYSNGSYHGGIDFPCPTGTEVYAAESGTVVTAKKLTTSYGYYIIIDHGDGLSTLYAHNSELLVTVGTKVARGQLIAYSGSTGNSTGPHCHFEVRLNNQRVNPTNYLSE